MSYLLFDPESIKSKKITRSYDGHTDWVTCIILLSNELFATGSGDATIKIWNL